MGRPKKITELLVLEYGGKWPTMVFLNAEDYKKRKRDIPWAQHLTGEQFVPLLQIRKLYPYAVWSREATALEDVPHKVRMTKKKSKNYTNY
jgi:hypothetical protein